MYMHPAVPLCHVWATGRTAVWFLEMSVWTRLLITQLATASALRCGVRSVGVAQCAACRHARVALVARAEDALLATYNDDDDEGDDEMLDDGQSGMDDGVCARACAS